MSVNISVIIPTYSPEDYIFECIESLERQTLKKKLYEVLIIVNGNKEPYFSNIEQRLKTCSFCSKLLYTSQVGVSNARNVGLNNAEGKYVCFIDDDDYVSANYLANLYSQITDRLQSIVVSNVKTFTSDSPILGNDYISLAFDYFSKYPTNSIFKKRKFLSSSCCKLIPMAVIANRRFNINYHLSEDALFMFEISDSINDIVLSDDSAIYYRRVRPNSASRTPMRFFTRLLYKRHLITHVILIYIQHIRRLNIWLFLSRIVAIIKFK